MELTPVVEKTKDDNLKLSNSDKTAHNYQNVKLNQDHPGKITGKNNTKGNKYRHMKRQDKWKLEAPKEVDALTKK